MWIGKTERWLIQTNLSFEREQLIAGIAIPIVGRRVHREPR